MLNYFFFTSHAMSEHLNAHVSHLKFVPQNADGNEASSMWFKKNRAATNGPVALPISIERVCAVFDKQGWDYYCDAENLILWTSFNDISFSISSHSQQIEATIICDTDKLTADRFSELLAWIEKYHNGNNPFPTMVALHGQENRKLLRMAAGVSLPNAWDYTDTQLQAWSRVTLVSIVKAGTAFYEEFDPQILEHIRAVRRKEE